MTLPARSKGDGGAESAPAAPDDVTSGVAGNERLTAVAGSVLLILIVVEILTIPALRALMTVHVLVGVLLAGPLIVKLGSAGYRFARYYGGSPAYVRRGPPRLQLRLLAPLLVVLTIVLIASGIALTVIGPANPGPFLAMHNVTFLAWLPVISIHVVAYASRAIRLVAAESSESPSIPPGRTWRLMTNGVALLLGALGAAILLPDAPPWDAWIQVSQAVPAPLIAGSVLTLVVLLIARPGRWA